MSALGDIMIMLQEFGIFEVYLPFLLTFAIFYGIFENTKIFGSDAKRINALIALVAGLYVTVFSPAAITITTFFSNFFAQASVGLVTLIIFLMILMMMASPFIFAGPEDEDAAAKAKRFKEIRDKAFKMAVGIGGLFAIGLFLSSGGLSLLYQTGLVGPGALAPESIIFIILIAITIGAIIFLVA